MLHTHGTFFDDSIVQYRIASGTFCSVGAKKPPLDHIWPLSETNFCLTWAKSCAGCWGGSHRCIGYGDGAETKGVDDWAMSPPNDLRPDCRIPLRLNLYVYLRPGT